MGPDFALFNQDDHVIPLSRALNNAEQVVVYFFPQPGAPGCTIEATGFRDIMPHLQARNVRLIGVTTGPQQELRTFAKANNLNFDVVWDGDQRTSSEWGALRGEHAARMTFILNYKGVVTHAWPRVNVYTHAAEVLAALGGPVEAGAAPAAEQAAPAAASPAAPVAQAASDPELPAGTT
ncbi:MAG TPA: redoxin domain-containing protein, partial [Pseudomonadota bacterium]|nr:redoxin domain-containing protein [Pseudomonadota bacterium]